MASTATTPEDLDLPDDVYDADPQIISTGNSELDKKIADGLPLATLSLIEGANDTGKSVLTQQIIWGAMRQSLNADLFTTENTTRSFLSQMEAMNLDISDYFAWGYLRVFPMHVRGFEWSDETMRGTLQRMIDHMSRSRADLIVIDSLTLFTEYSSQDMVLTFFTNCKNLVDRGKTILITLHTYAFEEESLVRIRSICDGHLFLKKAIVGGKYVMMLEVNKVRGARKTTGNIISFEVHPGYGIKIIPVTLAKV